LAIGEKKIQNISDKILQKKYFLEKILNIRDKD